MTPEEDFRLSVQLASGLGQELAKLMWKNCVSDARELHRLGMKVVEGEPFIDVSQPTGLGGKDMEPGMPLEEVPGRLMGFLLHFMEARLWSYAWFQYSFPEAFAALFSDEYADKAWKLAQQLWEASVDAESNANTFPSAWSLRQQVYWLSWPLVQFVLRWMAHMHFKPAGGFLCEFLRMCLTRIGDTKCVEETHRIGRGLENQGQRRVLEPDVFFARMQRGDTPFDHRGMPHARTGQDAAYCPMANSKLPASGLKGWSQIYAKHGLMRMPSFLAQKKEDVLSGRYLTKTPASGRSSITAAQALVHVHGLRDLSLARHVWHAIAFVPHTVVRSDSQVYLVLLADTYAAMLWPAQPCPPVPASGRSSDSSKAMASWVFDVADEWCWMVVTNATEWRFVPTKWVANAHDVARFGYLAAEQIALDVPVVAEALVQTHHRQLKGHFRKDLCALFAEGEALPDAGLLASGSTQLQRQQQLETMTMMKLLHGHPLLKQYLDRLEALHKKMRSRSKKSLGKRPKPHDQASESASSSDSQVDTADRAGCALTFACLDNIDEKNREELKKDTKTKDLFGYKGVKRMAREMVREDREVFRCKGSAVGPSALASGRAAGSSNLAWARSYVPGSEESGATLPADTAQSCLNNPPGRRVWVARFRHPVLKESKKRPTHSRTYWEDALGPEQQTHEEGKRAEHQAFQKVVLWLWERYEMVCRMCNPLVPASGRPAVVQAALAMCPACLDKSPCSFMSDLRKKTDDKIQHAEDADEGSVWSGAGSSASESSEVEDAQVAGRAGPRADVSQRPKPSALGGIAKGTQPASEDTLPKLLLLGDSNATGYCETQPLPKSLRFQLASKFVVCSAGKSGASWKSMAKGIHEHVHRCTKGGVAAKHSFKYVLVVLGTNDIPVEKQWEKQKDKLKTAMEAVLEGLKEYAALPDSGGQPDLKRILVTQAFNFEESRAVGSFTKLTQVVAESFGARFVAVPWEKERHVQHKTATPLKHFNFAGVELLYQRVCSELGLQISGEIASSLPVSGARGISRSGRVPTRRGASSSSLSSSSSSSSSSDAKMLDSPRPGLKAPPAKMFCEACRTSGHHLIQDCPLILVAMFDGDVAAAMKAISLLPNRYRSQGHLAKNIEPDEFQIIKAPPDGNCLFTSIMMAGLVCRKGNVPSYDSRGLTGAKCREMYLKWVEPYLQRDLDLPGTGMRAQELLVDVSRWGGHDEYLRSMRGPVLSRRQWGSWPEALAIASKWKLKVCVFTQDAAGSLVLVQAPCGAEATTQVMCLLWNGSHYDALRLHAALHIADAWT